MLFLLRSMDEEAADLHVWSLIWGTTYAATTAAQLIAIPFVQEPVRIDLTVGAVAAAVGSATLYLLPLRITSQAGVAHDDARDPDQCRALAKVEALFFKTANIDRLSGSWVAHAGNVAINAALVLILGVGFGHWPAAAIGGAIGVTVGEANLLTQPHELVGAERTYRAGLVAVGDANPVVPRFALLSGPVVMGAQLSWAW